MGCKVGRNLLIGVSAAGQVKKGARLEPRWQASSLRRSYPNRVDMALPGPRIPLPSSSTWSFLLLCSSHILLVSQGFLLPFPRSVNIPAARYGPRSTVDGVFNAALYASSSATPPEAKEPSTSAPLFKFCADRAVTLACFSFAIYGDPAGSRWIRASDGTRLGERV